MPYLFKVILIGDPYVGKTSIKKKYFGMGFQESYLPTLGVDFAVKTIGEDAMQIWDLAGQAGFQNFRSQFYNGAHGAVIVFDVLNRESLDNIQNWIDELVTNVKKSVPLGIVANKIDLRDENGDFISEEEAKNTFDPMFDDYKSKHHYIETSAMTGENIEMLFEIMLDQMIKDNG